MQLEKIEALIALFRDSSVGELALREGDSAIRLARFNHATECDVPTSVATAVAPQPAHGEAMVAAPTALRTTASPPGATSIVSPAQSTMQADETVATSAADPALSPDIEISSPMFGVVHLTPSPNDPTFVTLGERVVVGTPLCTVEAMKTFNTVEAEIDGVITAILVKSGDEVRPGQILFKIAS
jgi:acetyl-CoA carboxylase biotin carboxyl carrier protein